MLLNLKPVESSWSVWWGATISVSILLCKQGKLLIAWVSVSPTIRLVALHGMGRMSAEVPWRGGFCGISRQDKKAPRNSDFVHVARWLPRVSGLDKFGKL